MRIRSRPTLHVPCLLATTLALTACAGSAVTQRPTVAGADAFPEGVLRAYVWQCADGQRIVMRNLLPERAITIALQDGEHRLQQTMSASGVRYADDGERVVFWTKGETATLERTAATPVHCQERRAESLVEDARVRGVIYRALGNEPGWTLEIGPQAQLDWITNYGT
ncbi:MAG TPA: MliC family protein, partial [Steroidobacteraceae bacterium]